MKYNQNSVNMLDHEKFKAVNKHRNSFSAAVIGDVVYPGFSVDCLLGGWSVVETTKTEFTQVAKCSGGHKGLLSTEFDTFYCKIYRDGVLIHDPDVEIAKILGATDVGPVGAIGPTGPDGPAGVEQTDRPLHDALEHSRRETEKRREAELAKRLQEREQRQRELDNPYRAHMQADFCLPADQDVDEYDCLVSAGDQIDDAITYLGKVASAGIPGVLANLKAAQAIVERQIRREEFKLNKLAEEQAGCDGEEMVPF